MKTTDQREPDSTQASLGTSSSNVICDVDVDVEKPRLDLASESGLTGICGEKTDSIVMQYT